MGDGPARSSPQMGWEGANVIFDTWVHPLMMGLEEHLIGMFRHDFESVAGHRSHRGDGAPSMAPAADGVHGEASSFSNGAAAGAPAAATALLTAPAATAVADPAAATGAAGEPTWSAGGEAERHRILSDASCAARCGAKPRPSPASGASP